LVRADDLASTKVEPYLHPIRGGEPASGPPHRVERSQL